MHTGPSAATACEDINARAFTVGNHVAFNHGEYDPSSPAGQHVIAHELAHVRQQTGGAVSMLPQDELETEIDPDPKLEREAEQTAQQVMKGGELGIQRMKQTELHVQRKSYSPPSQEPTTDLAILNDRRQTLRDRINQALLLIEHLFDKINDQTVQSTLSDTELDQLHNRLLEYQELHMQHESTLLDEISDETSDVTPATLAADLARVEQHIDEYETYIMEYEQELDQLNEH